MRDAQIGRALRALRHRRGWRQSDLAVRAGVSRSVISSLEAGAIGRHALDALRQAVMACGGELAFQLRVPGGDLARLLDADHARLASTWADRLRKLGWLVEVEVTFNHYGERGSIDILAWHPHARVLLIAEVKTIIVDAQELLAGIDRKTRVGAVIARRRGWRPVAVVPALLVLDGSTARRRVADYAPLFATFSLVGRGVHGWLRLPSALQAPSGVLSFTKLPDARPGDRRRAGRQRMRLPRHRPRSARASPEPMKAADAPNDARTGV